MRACGWLARVEIARAVPFVPAAEGQAVSSFRMKQDWVGQSLNRRDLTVSRRQHPAGQDPPDAGS